MADKPNVVGPRELNRILGAANNESLSWKPASRFHEQCFQCGLTICRIGSQVREIAKVLRAWSDWLVYGRIGAAIERRDTAGTESGLQFCQRGAARIAQNQVEGL